MTPTRDHIRSWAEVSFDEPVAEADGFEEGDSHDVVNECEEMLGLTLYGGEELYALALIEAVVVFLESARVIIDVRDGRF